MHSVRIELAKLILVGTRITYQATGDAGLYVYSSITCFYVNTYLYEMEIVARVVQSRRGKSQQPNVWYVYAFINTSKYCLISCMYLVST